MNHALRLGDLVKEFNVSAEHIIDFLSNNGISIEKKINLKLSEEAYLLLQEEFKTDKLLKEKVNQIRSELPPLPPLNNKDTYEMICFKCDACDVKDNITVRDSSFVLKSNEPFKVWLFKLDFECKTCNAEINLHFEIQENTKANSNYIINLQGAQMSDCPKGESRDDDPDRDPKSDDFDPYENFHWGGLSGEEAYIGYWNTD